jgi:hypothetical protein
MLVEWLFVFVHNQLETNQHVLIDQEAFLKRKY